jgi:hypothetical protein
MDTQRFQPLFVKTDAMATRAEPLETLNGSLLFRLQGGYILPLRGQAEAGSLTFELPLRHPRDACFFAPGHAHPSVSSLDAFHVGVRTLVLLSPSISQRDRARAQLSCLASMPVVLAAQRQESRWVPPPIGWVGALLSMCLRVTDTS